MSDSNEIMPFYGGEITITEIKGKLPISPVSVPFTHEIYLFTTVVAGTYYVSNIEKIVENIKEDDELIFVREPTNKYDHRAIMIKTQANEKVGYVPRADNAVFARLMDAGKLLYAKISKSHPNKKVADLEIDIYLKD